MQASFKFTRKWSGETPEYDFWSFWSCVEHALEASLQKQLNRWGVRQESSQARRQLSVQWIARSCDVEREHILQKQKDYSCIKLDGRWAVGEEHGCQGRGPRGGLEACPTGRAEEQGLILWVVRTMGVLAWPPSHPQGLAPLRLVSWGLRAQGCRVGSPEGQQTLHRRGWRQCLLPLEPWSVPGSLHCGQESTHPRRVRRGERLCAQAAGIKGFPPTSPLKHDCVSGPRVMVTIVPSCYHHRPPAHIVLLRPGPTWALAGTSELICITWLCADHHWPQEVSPGGKECRDQFVQWHSNPLNLGLCVRSFCDFIIQTYHGLASSPHICQIEENSTPCWNSLQRGSP